ncbi:NADH:flavin oxidoreductase [Corynebacterium sp. BCW_4722]|nr:NADH:flavin oxidoreductase [Corynebacterium sp. BCW_4722]
MTTANNAGNRNPDAIFEPATLGPVELRNRFIKAATSEGRSPDGKVTDELIAYHEGFAAGGVGMTTLAYCATSPKGFSAPGQILMSKDALPGLKDFTATMHQHGAKASAQLGHAGPVATRQQIGETPWAPSRFINPTSFNYCRGIDKSEIKTAVREFADAAELAAEAGFDALELHFGHLYLPSSFLSGWINRRDDEYGGNIENRSRFAREIAAAVKERVGDDVAIIAKMSMTDGIPGSIELPDSLQTAQMLDADGNVDAILLTQGSSVLRQMWLFRGDPPLKGFAEHMPFPFNVGVRMFGKPMLGDFEYKDMYMFDDARQFLDKVHNSKLILLGGLTQREHFEKGYAEGFEFFEIGRALLREPDMVKKIQANGNYRTLCDHNNYCMPSVFGKTHCIYSPDYAMEPEDRQIRPEETAGGSTTIEASNLKK